MSAARSAPDGDVNTDGADPVQVLRHVAQLARLELAGTDVEAWSAAMTRVLEAFASVREAAGPAGTSHAAEDAAGAARADLQREVPLGQVDVTRPDLARPDSPESAAQRESLLANAPRREGPYFRVPKAIGGDA